MNKAVLISIQPYWVFLIIARIMGWNIPQDKTVEVRKDFPKDSEWNRRVHIYCSKSKKSFNRIPKEYQPLMAKFLGKVVGKFVCNKVVLYSFMNITPYPDEERTYFASDKNLSKTCLSMKEMENYGQGQPLYGWHISDLKIYDTPKELGEFRTVTSCKDWRFYEICSDVCGYAENNQCHDGMVTKRVTVPPQSWRYVEELSE